MSKAVPVLILTTIAPALACLHLVRELREERTQTASLQARIDELEKARAAAEVFTVLPRATPFSPATEQPPAVAPPPMPEPIERDSAAALANGPSMPPDVRDRIRAHMEQRREMMQQPQYREAMRARARLDMRRHYPGLMEELQMTQEEVDGLFDFLADQQVRSMEDNDALFMRGNSDEAQLREAQERFHARAEQQRMELETYLGPKYQPWLEYQHTLGQRHRLAAVQSTLALGGAPLNEAQAKSVLGALVQEQRRQQQQIRTQLGSTNAAGNTVNALVAMESSAAPFPGHEEWLERQEQSNERLLNAVRSELSSKQFDQLKEMFDSELEMQRTHLELQKAQGELPARTGVPSAAVMGGFAPTPVEASITRRAVPVTQTSNEPSSAEANSR